ncbi:unnamed protein product [Cuscuta epithymum]|uniref:Uncharacterized protein n=1 Tax=Cuscuta epithymum TaxID=186058 RepID=A0AAV0EWV9_9ASTE|nr:unnamed protein product [Cuscuta epithymum]
MHLKVHLPLPCSCSHLLLSTLRPSSLPPPVDAAVAGGVFTVVVETVVNSSLPEIAASPMVPVQSTARSSKMIPAAILDNVAAFSVAMLLIYKLINCFLEG